MADNLLFRGSSVSQYYVLVPAGSTVVVQRDKSVLLPFVDLPTSYQFIFPDERFVFTSYIDQVISVPTSVGSAFTYTAIASAGGSADIQVSTALQSISGFTYAPNVQADGLVFATISSATGFGYAPSIFGGSTVSANNSYGSSITYIPSIIGGSISIVGTSLASAITRAVNVALSPVISTEVIHVSGIAFVPAVYGHVQISAPVNSSSGITFIPIPKISTVIYTTVASSLTHSPTLSLGSTVITTTTKATGITYICRISTGTIEIDGGYTGTTDILDSVPALRHAQIYVSNNSLARVVAGHLGLNSGDYLIYLGNGQWKKRE